MKRFIAALFLCLGFLGASVGTSTAAPEAPAKIAAPSHTCENAPGVDPPCRSVTNADSTGAFGNNQLRTYDTPWPMTTCVIQFQHGEYLTAPYASFGIYSWGVPGAYCQVRACMTSTKPGTANVGTCGGWNSSVYLQQITHAAGRDCHHVTYNIQMNYPDGIGGSYHHHENYTVPC